MGHLVISMIMTTVMHTVDGCLYVECVRMCVHVCLKKNQNAPRPSENLPASFFRESYCTHIQICVRVHLDWCYEAFVDDTRSRRRPTEQCSGKASVCTAREVALRIAALAHLQEKAPRGATCPGRRGKVFFVSSLYVVRVLLQSARFGYRQTEMKHNIQNKQVDNSSQPGPKPNTTTRVRVLHLPVSGIQGQTKIKHTKFTTNKLTTAAGTKHSRKRQDFKKGFLVGWF